MSLSSTVQLQDCLARWRAGDEQAREELLRHANERLQRLTRKMMRDYPHLQRWEQTDDVLQNALLRLDRALRKVLPSSVREFFSLAALQIRRELIDLARHYFGPEGLGAHHASQGTPPTAAGSHIAAVEPADQSHEASRIASWSEFHECIEALPAEEREMFDLLWYQSLKQDEAAALLGVTTRTIKRRWQLARLKLHEALHGEAPG